MDNIPISGVEYNILSSAGNPNYLKIQNTTLYIFYVRYLTQKVFSVFDWNIPDSWNKEYLQYCLAMYGYVPVMSWPELGVIFQHGYVFGHDMYYQPAFINVVNPYINPKYTGTYRIVNEYSLNKIDYEGSVIGDCRLLKFTPDYFGIADIICNYAAEMALVHESVDINIIQAKDPKVFIANNKGSATAFKKAMDAAISGESAIIFDKDIMNADGSLNIAEFTKNLHDVYLADKLIDALRTIENRFDSMIGISNTNISKRANLTVAEVTANEDEVNALPLVWADCLRRSAEQINKAYNINVSITLKEGSTDDESIIDDTRSV